MIRYELYFALGGKHTDNAEQVNLKKVLELVCDTFGGYSLQKIQGGWKNTNVEWLYQDITMVEEDSYRLTLITDDVRPSGVKLLCDYIKRNFQQEEVMYTEEEVKVVRI